MQNLSKELEKLTGKPITELEDLVRNSKLDLEEVTLEPYACPMANKQEKTQADLAKCTQVRLLKIVGATVCADSKRDDDSRTGDSRTGDSRTGDWCTGDSRTGDWCTDYWDADIQLKLKVFGIEVYNRGQRLDKNQTEIRFNIDLNALKAEIKIGIDSLNHFCLYFDFNGEVYLPIHGWGKRRVRQPLFCFK